MTSTSWSSAPPPITPINIVPSTSNYITSTSSPSLLPTSTIPPSTRGSYYSLTRHTPRNPSGSIGRTGSVLLDRRSSYLPTTLDGVDLVSSWENVVSPRAHVSRLDGSQGVRSRSLSGRLSEFVNTPLPGAVILEEEEEPVYRPPTASSHAYLKPLIKCVIAYFIAQLWTFVPFLSQTLDDSVYGGKRSAHVIATVMVLLHPGRTIGEMIEADILVVCGLIFSAFICFGSMTLTVYLAENHIHVAHAVVLIILGLTCGLVGYTKITMNRPIWTTVCSLVSLVTIIVITKEGGFHLGSFSTEMITRILVLVLLGALVSNFVCLVIFPRTSTARLRNDINRTLSSFSTILNLLTAGFLLDSATAPPTAAALLDAIEIHSKTFSTLSASLATASFEVYDSRSRGYSDIVAGIIRLAQGLIGLRGSFRNEEGDSEDDVDFKSRIEVPLRDLTQRIQDLLQALMLDAPTSPNPFTDLHRLRAELSLSLETFRTAYASAIRSVALRLPVSTPNGVIPDPFIDTSKLDGHVSVDESMFKKYYYYGAQLNAWVGELLNLVDAFTKSKKVKRSVPHTQSKTESPFPSLAEPFISSHPSLRSDSWSSSIKYRIWVILSSFREPRIKFAMKTGFGVVILAIPAFIEPWRGEWLRWRGEWSMISYMVVMAQSEGATNFLALYRFFGTLAGGALAVAVFSLLGDYGIILPFVGAILSIPFFVIILTQPAYAPAARFLLLTYNLTCLYAFNLRGGEDDELNVFEIAWHRTIAVGAGVVWGLLITNLISPFEARRELRKELSQYFLNLAFFYESLVKSYSSRSPSLSPTSDSTDTERTPLISSSSMQDMEPAFLQMEIGLQQRLIFVSSLLSMTAHEPRLKGSFPISEYREIISSAQRLLDLLSSTSVRSLDQHYRAVVVPINKERREMVGNVILYLSILASAVSSKSPLPPFLPSAELSRQAVMRKMRKSDRSEEALAYLSYILTMSDVIKELEFLGAAFQLLFGISGRGTIDDFEALF